MLAQDHAKKLMKGFPEALLPKAMEFDDQRDCESHQQQRKRKFTVEPQQIAIAERDHQRTDMYGLA